MLGSGSVINVSRLAGVLAMALAACQTGGGSSVSVDEAKRVTAAMRETSFTPPPRMATDIVALLAQAWPEGEKLLAEQRDLVDRPPPTGLEARKLARFYSRRARAADLLGRARQKIDDLRTSVAFADKAERMDIIERIWLYQNYSEALLLGGDPIKARDILRDVLAKVPFVTEGIESDYEGEVQGHSMAWFGLLAATHGFLGELEAAEKAMKRVSAVNAASRGWPIGPRERGIFDEMAASSRATVLDLLGRFDEAEIQHRKALKALAPFRSWRMWLGVTHEQLEREQQWRRAHLAVNLSRQGRLLEAENEARSALQAALRTQGRYSIHTNAMVQTLITIFYAQGRFEETEKLSRVSLDSLGKLGVPASSLVSVNARVRLADSLAASGRWDEAVTEFAGIEKDLADSPETFRALVDGNVNWGLSLLRVGRAELARSVLAKAVKRTVNLYGESHYASAEARGFLAMADAAVGDRARALKRFSGAVSVLLGERTRSTGEAEGVAARTGRLTTILEDYLALLAEVRGTALESDGGVDATAEGFRLADAARGAAVQQALSASAARSAAGDPDLADLVRQEQDAAKRIDSLFGLLNNVLNLPNEQQDADAVEDLRTRIDQLRGARAALARISQTP